MPIGLFYSYNYNHLNITKKHFSKTLNRNLTLSEIFEKKLAFAKKTSDYDKKNIELIDFKSEELIDIVDEMIESISNNFELKEEDQYYLNLFLNICGKYITNNELYSIKHGKLIGRFSIKFLKKNDWFIKK